MTIREHGESQQGPRPRKLHPFCNKCGWRKGGIDCWDKDRCKCGHWEPPMPDQPATVTDIETRR
jgi:hypothetical protein